MTSYYQQPFCSNSCLTALARELASEGQEDLADSFRFGTLFHAMVLEAHKVDYITQSVLDSKSGQNVFLTGKAGTGKNYKQMINALNKII